MVVGRVIGAAQDDNLTLIAAGCAFFVLLALIPSLTVLVSLYGLIFDPTDIAGRLARFEDLVPATVLQTIDNQLRRIAETENAQLSLTLAGSLTVSLWSAGNGARTLMSALNIAYGETEDRPFWLLAGQGIGIVLCSLLGFIMLTALLAALPAALAAIQLGILESVLKILRWPLLLIALTGYLAILYRVGPSRRDARWRWILPGAVLAAAALVALAIAFNFVASQLVDFGQTYGSLSAAITLLLWAYLSMIIVLVGAELNGQLERQTLCDSTIGDDRPIGKRGANSADEILEKRLATGNPITSS